MHHVPKKLVISGIYRGKVNQEWFTDFTKFKYQNGEYIFEQNQLFILRFNCKVCIGSIQSGEKPKINSDRGFIIKVF